MTLPAVSEKQTRKRKLPRTAFQPGKSGNPAGRPVDPRRKDAIEILKNAAPDILKKAFDMVFCEKPDPTIMRALIGKIVPDNINLQGQLTLVALTDDQLKSRAIELAASARLIGVDPDTDGT